MVTDGVVLRPARAGDGQAAYDVTLTSVRTLQATHYPAAQLAIWMGTRTPEWHEALIGSGTMIVAERAGRVVGFVHTMPGETTGCSFCRKRQVKD